jgi:hypothetical protein
VDQTPEGFTPKVMFSICSNKSGGLGKKVGDVDLEGHCLGRTNRFNRSLESNPGLAPHVLPKRPEELNAAGFIERIDFGASSMMVCRGLT